MLETHVPVGDRRSVTSYALQLMSGGPELSLRMKLFLTLVLLLHFDDVIEDYGRNHDLIIKMENRAREAGIAVEKLDE